MQTYQINHSSKIHHQIAKMMTILVGPILVIWFYSLDLILISGIIIIVLIWAIIYLPAKIGTVPILIKVYGREIIEFEWLDHFLLKPKPDFKIQIKDIKGFYYESENEFKMIKIEMNNNSNITIVSTISEDDDFLRFLQELGGILNETESFNHSENDLKVEIKRNEKIYYENAFTIGALIIIVIILSLAKNISDSQMVVAIAGFVFLIFRLYTNFKEKKT